jgi:hypothetical protein
MPDLPGPGSYPLGGAKNDEHKLELGHQLSLVPLCHDHHDGHAPELDSQTN